MNFFYLFDNEKGIIVEYEEIDVMDNLYYQVSKIPTGEQMKHHLNNFNDEISKFINKYGIAKSIQKIKKSISKIEEKIPLFDIYSENIYLINKKNVYHRIVNNYYRILSKGLIDNIIKKRDILKNKLKNKYSKNDIILMERKERKFDLALEFINFFDIDELFNTYMRIFYLYSDTTGGDITVCERPSFLPHFIHIKPYYSKNEILNLGLNMGFIIDHDCSKKNILDNSKSIPELCQLVKNNDISAKILLKHQEYMINENKVGLIQYYSLHGSYSINQYMRDLVNYEYKNIYLEEIIKSMWALVKNAPKFDKNYTLYRFINNDYYLRHLDIGDIYTEPGFMSTTRDPFYRPDLYNFGFVLLKINIPKDVNGIGLSVETLSHFPKEQEIILSPLSMFKLIKKDKNCQYYHTNRKFTSQIKTRYEFEYIGNGEINFKDRLLYESTKEITFLDIIQPESETLEEKINYFFKEYLNPMYQCKVKIGDKLFKISSEFFDSTGAYKEFYAIETKKGFSIYSVFNNYILFFIEMGTQDNTSIMHVDYNRKYSMVRRENIISDEDFIYFISSIANYFAISKVVVYSEYITCDIKMSNKNNINMVVSPRQRQYSGDNNSIKINQFDDIEEINYYGGRYCVDLFNYIIFGQKRYENSKILPIEMNPKFSYYMLDKLKVTKPLKILNKEDIDEIYQIYDKTYKNYCGEERNNIKDFFSWIVMNKCYLVEIFVSKLSRLYKNDNPFELDHYILDPYTYLYNRGYIGTYPKTIANLEFKLKRNISIIPLNEYKYRTRDD